MSGYSTDWLLEKFERSFGGMKRMTRKKLRAMFISVFVEVETVRGD